MRSRGGLSLSLLRFLKSSTTLDHKPSHCQTRRAKWVHKKLGMRPAWVQSQVRPTLAESYGLQSLSKNLMEKEEGGWRESFYSPSVHPPCWYVRNQISPSPLGKKWRERNSEKACPSEEGEQPYGRHGWWQWERKRVANPRVGQEQRSSGGLAQRHLPSPALFTLQGNPCC